MNGTAAQRALALPVVLDGILGALWETVRHTCSEFGQLAVVTKSKAQLEAVADFASARSVQSAWCKTADLRMLRWIYLAQDRVSVYRLDFYLPVNLILHNKPDRYDFVREVFVGGDRHAEGGIMTLAEVSALTLDRLVKCPNVRTLHILGARAAVSCIKREIGGHLALQQVEFLTFLLAGCGSHGKVDLTPLLQSLGRLKRLYIALGTPGPPAISEERHRFTDFLQASVPQLTSLDLKRTGLPLGEEELAGITRLLPNLCNMSLCVDGGLECRVIRALGDAQITGLTIFAPSSNMLSVVSALSDTSLLPKLRSPLLQTTSLDSAGHEPEAQAIIVKFFKSMQERGLRSLPVPTMNTLRQLSAVPKDKLQA